MRTPFEPFSFRCDVSRTCTFSLFKTDATNLRWTKAICQAQTIKTFPLWGGEGQWQVMGRLLRGIVTRIHMWSLASGNPVSGSLNVCLRTQYPCGYNYNHCTKEECHGFITSLNKEERSAPEFPGKFLKYMCVHAHTQYSYFLFLWTYITISFSLREFQGALLWSKCPFLIIQVFWARKRWWFIVGYMRLRHISP